MQDVWMRLEALLEEKAPEIRKTLGAPATEAAIREAEAKMGTSLPADVRASYLLHDGQEGDSYPLFGAFSFAPLEYVVSYWETLGKLDPADAEAGGEPRGPVRANWWNPRWIPFTAVGNGDYACVDLAPAPGGRAGQVVSYSHEEPDRFVIARGFREWLIDLADRLEDGRLVFDSEYGLVDADGVEAPFCDGCE